MFSIHRNILRGFLALYCAAEISALAASEGLAETPVRVTAAPASEIFPLGGPIAINLNIMNVANQDIFVDVDTLGPPNFEVSMKTPDGMEIRSVRQWLEGRRLFVSVAADKTFNAVFFLNDLLPIRNPGKYEITFSCSFDVSLRQSEANVPAGNNEIRYSEKITFVVKAMGNDVIKAMLEKESAKTLSDDRQMRTTGIAALCNTDSPLVVPHLIGILKVLEARLPAVRALARFNSDEATSALRNMLNSNESGVVKVVLDALDLRDASVTDEELGAILASLGDSIRYTALQYAIERKRTIPAPTLTKLLVDANPGIANLAQKYAEIQK